MHGFLLKQYVRISVLVKEETFIGPYYIQTRSNNVVSLYFFSIKAQFLALTPECNDENERY